MFLNCNFVLKRLKDFPDFLDIFVFAQKAQEIINHLQIRQISKKILSIGYPELLYLFLSFNQILNPIFNNFHGSKQTPVPQVNFVMALH